MVTTATTVAGSLLGVVAVGSTAALGAAVLRRERPYLPGSLATGLDLVRDPLAVALHHGYAGVEVAVRLTADGELRLADPLAPPSYHGTGHPLDRMVLAPLAARVKPTSHGRVYPAQGEPFLVLLELLPPPRTRPAGDGDPDRAYEVLDGLLRAHGSMLTRYANGRVTRGAVTVVLTGDRWPHRAVALAYERYAFLEGGVDDLGDPARPATLVPLIRDALAERVGWDPRDVWPELPAEARHILRSLVRAVQQDGRQVRFVDVPDRPRSVRTAMWRELYVAGADFIGTDRVSALARFLRQAGARRPPSHAMDERQLNRR